MTDSPDDSTTTAIVPTTPEGKTWHPTKGYVPIADVEAQASLDDLQERARVSPPPTFRGKGVRVEDPGFSSGPQSATFVPAWMQPVHTIEIDEHAIAEAEAKIAAEIATLEAQTGKPLDALQAHAARYRSAGLAVPPELLLRVGPPPPAPTPDVAQLAARVRDLEGRLAVGTAVVTPTPGVVPIVPEPGT